MITIELFESSDDVELGRVIVVSNTLDKAEEVSEVRTKEQTLPREELELQLVLV